MDVNDIVFYCSLLLCISLGSHYKKIERRDMKRNYGAGLGMLVACLTAGQYIFHSLFLVWGNTVIIKCGSKRYVHQMCLAYTMTYLTYIHCNVESTRYMLWLHQTLSLRMVGLAFELFLADKQSKIDNNRSSMMATSTLKLIPVAGDLDILDEEITSIDIIAYAFFFIGIHKGPYYRWKIFNDHFNAPFGRLGDCRVITEQKLKKAVICAFGYILLSINFSTDAYYDDSFYTDYGADFRFLYNIPLLMKFFLEYQIIMMLATSVCTEAGFGVYPAVCQPVPGLGPSKRQSLIKMASDDPDVAMEQDYNFAMIKCFDYEKVIWGPKMRDTFRGWDMSTRYWFWAYMHRSFIRGNKEVRSACAFLVWSIYRGPSSYQFIVSLTLWIYVHLETEYSELYDSTGPMKVPWDIGFSIMRMFCLVYLTPCWTIRDSTAIYRYYHSIYWIYHLVILSLMALAVWVYKSREFALSAHQTPPPQPPPSQKAEKPEPAANSTTMADTKLPAAALKNEAAR